jgi:NAD(P)-dependent dehydrogenase (short-subunit alcohol dehydrogenase family)
MTARPLTSKVALVTGGSSGIGAEVGRAMAAAGAHVVLVGRNGVRLSEVADSIRATGGVAHTVVRDLDEDDAAAAIVAQTLAAAGGVDILVHVAGRFELGPVNEIGVDSLDRQYRTNVRAPYSLTLAARPYLGGGGVIVFISSIAAHVGFPGAAAYCASKGAIAALVPALAGELAPEGIRVNAIAPGEIDTPMNADYYKANPEYLPAVIQETPARRVGKPADIAASAVFLATDAASFIHGVTLVVDGGLTATVSAWDGGSELPARQLSGPG